MQQKSKYSLSISLSVLDDLGINLYSNAPAVLSEVVANSWDADATKVEIEFNKEKNIVTIKDNGCGMSEEDINGKYLTVGYKKREKGEVVTPKYNRPVMGRKGIGKLSLFSIAKTIEVHSVKEGSNKKNGLIMNVEKIKDAIRKNDGMKPYEPDVVDKTQIKINGGTCITLSDLKKDISGIENYLRTRLARRFSVIGDEYKFQVIIDGQPISIQDRDYMNKIQYLWTIGKDGKRHKENCTSCEKHEHIDGIIDSTEDCKISGWIGTFDAQKNIPQSVGNSIVVLARGKLIHEDILKDIKEGGLYTKYIIGEVQADFVDLDEQPDMATSDRQSLIEDDPRFKKLKTYIQGEILKKIQKSWTEWRKEDATKKALENDSIKKWFEKLGPDKKKYAKKLFGVIGGLPLDDENTRKELYKHGILAFEKLVLKDMLSEIASLKTEKDIILLSKIFSGIDELEATEYYIMIKGRLEILKIFAGMVDEDSKEKIIQKHIFDHLWLLHPSWERASTNERIEEGVKKEFEAITKSLTKDERKGRIDIRYKTAAGKHIIIELKKPSVVVEIHDLCKQISKYRSALEKCLKEKFQQENPNIEIICVLGKSPSSSDNDETRKRELLQAEKARYITYDNLIKETLESYKDYLEKSKNLGELQTLIDSI